jgi:predicted metal-dependent phosphoesterase TrpH
MKIELHLHTTRYSPCARATPEQMMQRLVAAGYEAVYITEHDAVWRADELADLGEQFPSLRIFGGVELTIGAHHLLVLGTSDPTYLDLHEESAVLDKARAAGHLTILAHPFRWDGGAGMLEIGMRPDALEARTNNHDEPAAQRARRVASELGLKVVNSSDAHDVDALDKFWVETAAPITAAEDIRDVILNGAYELQPQPAAPKQ